MSIRSGGGGGVGVHLSLIIVPVLAFMNRSTCMGMEWGHHEEGALQKSFASYKTHNNNLHVCLVLDPLLDMHHYIQYKTSPILHTMNAYHLTLNY